MAEVDVAVVGAGAAGLAAAKVLRAGGCSVAVLEAMDRIGGRAHTSSAEFGIPFDIGCAWLHAADRNPFFPEAQAAGWTLHPHDMGVDHLYHGDRRADVAGRLALAEAEAELAALIDRHAGDGQLSQLIGDCHALRAVATFCGPMDLGADFDEVSIADYRRAAELEPNYFTREGFGALVARFGADVDVTLSAPVRSVDWSGPGVALETPRGTVRARAAILTVSTGVLAFDEIAFRPALPEAHVVAAFDLPMGLLTKIPLEIRGDRMGLKPFDDLLIERHALHDIFFLCFPFDCDLMVGFVGGDFAWEVEAAGAAAAADFAVDRLAAIFGSDLRRRVARTHMTNWAAERHVRGAYASARPGRAAAREVLATPVADRLFFAGEALAPLGLTQTCAGARLSGEAVARQVLDTLGLLQGADSGPSFR